MAVNVLVAAPHLGADLSWIEDAVEGVRVLDGNDPTAREALLADAEVMLLGFPVPAVIAANAPRLEWVHHTQAGVSNLLGCDLWESTITLTSSRGLVGTRAIAEYAIAGIFHFSRGLDTAVAQRETGTFDRRGYDMRAVAGSTLGVVGLGGIGREVARLGRNLGMHVIATRRRPTETRDPDVDELMSPDELITLLGRSDYVVLCAQLTDETRNLFDSTLFAAMRPGSVFVNIARGEEVDETALVASVRSGHLRGALLDVHRGESRGRAPDPALVETEAIVLTPHVAGSGEPRGYDRVKALFLNNLSRYLDGQPLDNLVDRERGY